MSGKGDSDSSPLHDNMQKQENQKQLLNRDVMLSGELWTDGMICAFEFVRSNKKTTSLETVSPVVGNNNKRTLSSLDESTMTDHSHSPRSGYQLDGYTVMDMLPGDCGIPIGLSRISELIQTIQIVVDWAAQRSQLNDEEDITVADVAIPYWERAVGPTWWCHVAASHPFISNCLTC